MTISAASPKLIPIATSVAQEAEDFVLVDLGQSPSVQSPLSISVAQEVIRSPTPSGLSDTSRLLCMSPASFSKAVECQTLKRNLSKLEEFNETNAATIHAFKLEQDQIIADRKILLSQIKQLFLEVYKDESSFPAALCFGNVTTEISQLNKNNEIT